MKNISLKQITLIICYLVSSQINADNHLNHQSQVNSNITAKKQSSIDVIDSNKPITTIRQLENFDEVESKISANIDVVFSDDHYCEISGNKKIVDNISSEIKSFNHKRRLIIDTRLPYMTRQHLRIKISAKHLSSIIQSGSGNINIHNYQGDVLNIALYGSGDIFGNGNARQLQLFLYGSGSLYFDHLKANNVLANINGSGEIITHSLNNLTSVINGNGRILYYGYPNNIHQTIIGNGELINLN